MDFGYLREFVFALLVIGILYLYLILLLVGVFIIAAPKTWFVLGRIYKYSGAFQGKVWRFRDVIIGDKGSLLEQSRYKWITVGANQEGVYFVAPLVFHPKLFIPWEDVTITYCEGLISLWGYPVKLEFRQAPLVWFRITENLAKQLVGVAGLSLSR